MFPAQLSAPDWQKISYSSSSGSLLTHWKTAEEQDKHPSSDKLTSVKLRLGHACKWVEIFVVLHAFEQSFELFFVPDKWAITAIEKENGENEVDIC